MYWSEVKGQMSTLKQDLSTLSWSHMSKETRDEATVVLGSVLDEGKVFGTMSNRILLLRLKVLGAWRQNCLGRQFKPFISQMRKLRSREGKQLVQKCTGNYSEGLRLEARISGAQNCVLPTVSPCEGPLLWATQP